MKQWKNFSRGLLKENPAFVLFLGLCPMLGTTTSAYNGLMMGLATTFVLVLSSMVVSLIANQIPDKVRIPAYIVIIASFVTIVDLLMKAYMNTPGPSGEPSLYDQLGIFIPLIVVNCLVLGRAEAFASKNKLLDATANGLGMGFGFALALMVLGAVREILGSGSIFSWKFIAGDGILIFILAPGAFIASGYLIAIVNKINNNQ